MRVIPPLAITDARLTSSTAAEPGVGETAWTSGASFAAGDRAILGSPTATVTMTIASPGVITWTGNGLPNGTPVVLTTTGALPTGLTAGTAYYVINRAVNTFQLAAEPDGAPIVTTGSQSGTHTGTAQLHRTYESLVGSNTGNPPAIDDGTKWIDVGPTNRWGMLDLLRNTRTWQASPLTVVITPGVRINSLALLGLVADSVTVSATSGGSPVYSEVFDLSTREVLDWYDYFFEDFSTKPSVVLFDLPPYTNLIVTVAITRTSGLVGCGGLVLGSYVELGQTQHGAESDALNFSRVERDEYGNSSLTQRRSVPRANLTVRGDKTAVNKMLDLRVALNAVPAVWTGLDEDDHGYFEALLILGIYKRFTINAAHAEHAMINLELEEV
jgi:hypothetical protein